MLWSLLRAGSARPGCLGMCPVKFWATPGLGRLHSSSGQPLPHLMTLELGSGLRWSQFSHSSPHSAENLPVFGYFWAVLPQHQGHQTLPADGKHRMNLSFAFASMCGLCFYSIKLPFTWLTSYFSWGFLPPILLRREMIEWFGGHLTSPQDQTTTHPLCKSVFFSFLSFRLFRLPVLWGA